MRLLNKLSIFILFCAIGFTSAAVSFPPQPNITKDSYVVDAANMLTTADTQAINKLARKLYVRKGVPLLVVTINSLADYGVKADAVSAYDKILFSHFHYETDNGVMFLLIKKSRDARIQFGRGLGRKYLPLSRQILRKTIVPAWEKGQVSSGVRVGVAQMVNDMLRR